MRITEHVEPPHSVESLDAELAAKVDTATRARTIEERDAIVLHVCLQAVRWYPGLRQTREALRPLYGENNV